MSKSKRMTKAQVDAEVDELELPKSGQQEEKSLKELIAEYCGEHQLEGTLNDVINKCVKERPEDPFGFMSELLKERSNAATGILSIAAREVLDCSGRPTVETEIKTDCGTFVAQVRRRGYRRVARIARLCACVEPSR